MLNPWKMSLILPAIIVLLTFETLADSKITTRNTVMGNTTEGTTYVKGARERTEMQMPMGMGKNVTILQCDQKRMIVVNPQANTCMVTPLGESGGGSQAAAPAEEPSGSAPERKGGTVTLTTNTTDTGERQKMFGLEARHLKSTVSMQASPDACSQGSMNMETDGWYADISPGLTCRSGALAAEAAHRRPARGCRDKFQLKNTGMALSGFPLKQTVTMNAGGHSFSTTHEVTDLSTATLDPSLFDMPAGCRVVNSYQELMGTPGRMPGMPAVPGRGPGGSAAVTPTAPAPAPAAAPPTPAPAAAPAPVIATKAAGVLRVGVVKIKDATGQYLPTDNLRVNLMSEVTKRSFEAVPLDAEAPTGVVLVEAQQKQCDYVLYTTAQQVSEPRSGGSRAAGFIARHEAGCRQISGAAHHHHLQSRKARPGGKRRAHCRRGRPVRRQCGNGRFRAGG